MTATMMSAEALLEAALDVPALGGERADWQARGLAELLVQALATDDGGLADVVVRAVPSLGPVGWRFAERLGALGDIAGARFGIGSMPAMPYLPTTPVTPRLPDAVPAAAGRLARVLDTRRGHGPARPGYLRRVAATAHRVAEVLERAAGARPAAISGHRCLDLAIPAGLTWRAWLAAGGGPLFAATPRLVTEAQLRVWLGLHVGTHLDLLARSAAPVRWQFGRDLLVAEAAAMAVELSAYLTSDRADEVAVLRAGLIERLSRLPGIGEWGPRVAANSAAMASAAAMSSPEFVALPTLACAYVAGPFELAESRFRGHGLPRTFADAVDHQWRRAGLAGG